MTLTVAPTSVFPTTSGGDVAMFPAVSECSVAQAAEFLDMSERCLNGLLDAEQIASRLENGERLVQWSSMLDYQQMRIRRRAGLAQIIRWDQEMGLYDD